MYKKDGRLRINDQIFQIGDINVRSMSSEQVASVLRQSSMQGQMVKFIVARPIHNSVSDIEMVSSSNIEKIEFDANNKPIITNLKSPHSQSVVVKTSEIITDKKLNLLHFIEAERIKMISEKTEETNSDVRMTIEEPREDNKKQFPCEEKTKNETTLDDHALPMETTSASFETANSCVLIINLELTTEQKFSTLLDALNWGLKKFSIVLDTFSEETKNYLYVKETKIIENMEAGDCIKNIEIYDYLMEINGQSVEVFSDLKDLGCYLTIKFYRDASFKLKVLYIIFWLIFR